MKRRTFRITNSLGLHARPATLLAGVASRYRSTIMLELAGQRASAHSVLELLMLQAQSGAELTVTAIGADAEAALAAIEDLIEDGFGEHA